MKKVTLSLAIALSSYCTHAQNTFPTPTGNVAIGTNNPTSTLSIGGNSSVNPNTTGSDILYSAITFQNNSYYNVGRISSLQENGNYMDAGGLAFSTGYGTLYERFRIKTNGNIGIGTPNPTALLDVYNSANSTNTIVRISGTAEAAGNYTALLLGAGGFQGRGKGGVFFEPEGTTYGFGKLHFAVNRVASDGEATLSDVKMTIIGNGNVGIGTTSPATKLDVVGGAVQVTNPNPTYALIDNSNAGYNWAMQNTAGAFRFYDVTANAERMRITPTGNVLIGKASQQPNVTYKLDIGGSARADQIVVNTTGADFVFDKKYALPELSDVKAYINKNHHLPEIPSAKEMQKDGLNVGEINTKLLQKVEELTLYLIEKDKQVKEQEARIATLEKALLKQPRKHLK